MSRTEQMGAAPDAKRPAGELPASLDLIVAAVEDLKGIDLLILDVRGIASFTDYLAICTGNSDRHVQAIADGIKNKLRAAEITPLHTEGYEQAAWVLVDYVDFLVNVFTREARGFYQLERVWRDAPVLVGERAEAPPEEPAAGEPATDPEGGAAAAPTDPEGAAAGAADG